MSKLQEQYEELLGENYDILKENERLRAENARLRDLLDNALGWLDDKEHDKPLLSVDSIRAAMGETE